MKTLVVYFTKFGNTRRIAEVITQVLAQAGDASAVSIDQLATSELGGVDLVVMGSPTHYQNLPGAVGSVLKALPSKILAGTSVATFDTSLRMWGPLMLLTAAHRLTRLLRKLGGRRVARPQTFFVETSDSDNEGEIDLMCDGEIERAKEWAGTILEQWEAQAT
jgi:flavodoxin